MCLETQVWPAKASVSIVSVSCVLGLTALWLLVLCVFLRHPLKQIKKMLYTVKLGQSTQLKVFTTLIVWSGAKTLNFYSQHTINLEILDMRKKLLPSLKAKYLLSKVFHEQLLFNLTNSPIKQLLFPYLTDSLNIRFAQGLESSKSLQLTLNHL